jgi:serine/threonine protein phosphatase 1
MGQFAIGDIHGCLNTLKSLLFKKIKISKKDTCYFMGDYIDRGPRIKETLDFLIEQKKEGWDFRFLMGNHEHLLLNLDLNNKDDWEKSKGRTTFQSLGISNKEQIKEKYWKFFSGLEYYFETDKFVLVHASINTKIDDPFSDTFSMIWSRDFDLDISKIENRNIIVGHTPKTQLQIIKSVKSLDKTHVVFTDAGCVYDKEPFFGYLCGYDLEKSELYFQKNIE